MPKLFLRFRNIGQDVGHYDCVVIENTAEATSDIPEPPNLTRNHPPTPPERRFNDLLQVPTVPKRKTTHRCEKATLLTSSPSRTNLQAKPDKKRRSSTRREQKSNRRRTLKHITFLRFLTTRRRRAVPVYNASNFTEIADPELYGFHAKSTFNGPMKIALMGPLSSSVPNVTRVIKIHPNILTVIFSCY